MLTLRQGPARWLLTLYRYFIFSRMSQFHIYHIRLCSTDQFCTFITEYWGQNTCYKDLHSEIFGNSSSEIFTGEMPVIMSKQWGQNTRGKLYFIHIIVNLLHSKPYKLKTSPHNISMKIYKNKYLQLCKCECQKTGHQICADTAALRGRKSILEFSRVVDQHVLLLFFLQPL